LRYLVALRIKLKERAYITGKRQLLTGAALPRGQPVLLFLPPVLAEVVEAEEAAAGEEAVVEAVVTDKPHGKTTQIDRP